MYSIVFTSLARKQIKKFDKASQKRVIAALERIRIRPEKFVSKLVDSEYYRLRVGPYRVILDIVKGNLVILVIKVAHRKNVYN